MTKQQSDRYDISESLCLVNISVWGGLPYYRSLGNDRFVTIDISGSRCIVNISVWEGLPYYRPLAKWRIRKFLRLGKSLHRHY